ncbi:MAG TPA: type VI secretion system baseplate subunit TssG [Acinetobacter sp.]|nr:type VI secretion system baseplate subunit TssG [Acinetobacter sp.]
MRSERWWQEASVIDGLFHMPTAYEFIQTTRLLRHDPIFNQVQHWADRFSFESSIQLNFPIAEIESLNLAEDKIELKNLMVGLLGIQGALPYSYTQKIKLSPRKQRDEVQKFIGLFNHKLTAQYVDSSLVYNLPVRYEIDQNNHYLTILHALNGFVRQQHQPSDLNDFFAEFSGLMQGQNNNVHALKTMLHCVFKQKIEIKEFIVETFQLNDVQKTSLGGLAKNALGLNTFCGEKVRQVDGKIEVQIGPLNYQHYLDYLPGKGLSEQLRKIFKSWCDPTLHVDVRLILKRTDKKAVQIGANQSLGLGQGTFLMPKLTEDHNEFCYALIREI